MSLDCCHGDDDSPTNEQPAGLCLPSATESIPDPEVEFSVGLSDCSDEILLAILSYVPSHSLLSVACVCKRFLALSSDRSLLSHISFSGEYSVTNESVRAVLRQGCVRSALRSLDMEGCYWLLGASVCEAARCTALQTLNLSGCVLTASRLDRLLGNLSQLRKLSLDVGHCFDSSLLTASSRRTLANLEVLSQTLLFPSYGVLALCPGLRRLELNLEVGGASAEGVGLAVGQSSVPHYEHLSSLCARLAPGPANRTLLALLLAPLSLRPMARLHHLVISAPGPAPPPPRPSTLSALLDSLVAGLTKPANGKDSNSEESTALQLPGSWLDEKALGCVLSNGCPAYLSLSRGGPPPSFLASYQLSSLRELNLSGCSQELEPDWLQLLCESSPHLRHLNLSGMHYHHGNQPGTNNLHPCSILAKLTDLRSLALSVCAVAEGNNGNGTVPSQSSSSALSPLQGLRKARRVGVATLQAGEEPRGVSCLRELLIGCKRMEELELVGAEFLSAMPRYEAANRKQAAACPFARSVGDAALAALAWRTSLRSLTLAGIAGVQTGVGLDHIARNCSNLVAISLANLGNAHTVCYSSSLLSALPHCRSLRDLRIEQPYFNANVPFFEALSECEQLQRLCIISRNGTFVPAAVTSFMQRCSDVIMCHLFMGGTLVACRTLQKSLIDSFSGSRPALSVCVFPLLHEELPEVVRQVPLCHLHQLALFRSRVAQQPAQA